MHTNAFESKTLVGNWWEERCQSGYEAKWGLEKPSLTHPRAGRYTTTTGTLGTGIPQSLHADEKAVIKPPKDAPKFVKSTDNWLSFQPEFEGTFKTTQRESFKQAADQSSPFKLRETKLTGDKDALKSYQDTWTKAGHNFSRIYCGADDFKKAKPEFE